MADDISEVEKLSELIGGPTYEEFKADKQHEREDIWRADDMVNHPPHYTQGNIECIDAIESSMTPEEFAGFLKGQIIKYIWRYEKKWNPLEDLEKTNFYLDRLIKHSKKHPDIFREDYSLRVDVTAPINIPQHMAQSISEALDNMDGHV